MHLNTASGLEDMAFLLHINYVCMYTYLFIGETAFNNLFMAGLDEGGRDLIIVSALSNNKRAEYDLSRRDKT